MCCRTDLKNNMEPISPSYTTDLFPPLHQELIGLLRSLSPEDWQRPTVAPGWQVRDVVAHLLDIDLRKLSVSRDQHVPPSAGPIGGYKELVAFLNGLNAGWVAAARRLSPRMLVDLHSFTGPLVSELVTSLPPHEPAAFSVSWAGENESENWFDIGRDYTERWHHQMQIRDSVGATLLLERRWLFPLLDLSFRSLPHVYRDIDAPNGTAVTVRVSGDGDDTWSLLRDGDQWKLYRGSAPDTSVIVTFDPDTVWRLLYNALPPAEARRNAVTEGNAALAEPLFIARSVMV